MKNNFDIQLKKILYKIFSKNTINYDKYVHNGSTWFILTDEKKWVIELTKEGTLWYNYYFFQNCFKLLSLDVVENQHYITKWVEDTILSAVNHTNGTCVGDLPFLVEDTIQNGVKETHSGCDLLVDDYIEDTTENVIKNGVKYTQRCSNVSNRLVEDTIQNGIKETIDQWNQNRPSVKDVVESGIKATLYNINLDENQESEVSDVIKNGMFIPFREATPEPSQRTWMTGVVIESGIKETKHGVHFFEDTTENIIKHGEKIIKETYHDEYHHNARIGGVIKNGVKETNPNHLMGDLTIKEVIQNGVKETKKIEHDRTTYHGYFNQERGTHTPLDRVQDVVKNGVKQTQAHVLQIYNPMNFELVFIEDKRMVEIDNVLDKGVKEVQPLPAQDGNRDWGNYYYSKGEPTKPHTKYVDEVITEGEKIQ